MKVLASLAFRGPRPAALIVLGFLLAGLLLGCGKKGPVRPKLATVPEAPREVTLQQQGRLLILGWSLPLRNLDGTNVEDLVGFRIRRLAYDAQEGCPTCRDPQEVVAEIDLRYPDPAQRIGSRFYWRDSDIRQDTGYRYAVTARTIGDLEGPPALVHRSVIPPPPSPVGLQVVPGDAQIALEWGVPELAPGQQLLGYNLYRRDARRPFPIIPVNAEPLEATHLVDRGLDNSRAYEYRVSSLVRVGDQVVESMATPGVLATPQPRR
ncbi:MAG: hypothetical protein P8Y91_00025 [Desulfuromonadales bacterium]|jgi:hypothetical protein